MASGSSPDVAAVNTSDSDLLAVGPTMLRATAAHHLQAPARQRALRTLDRRGEGARAALLEQRRPRARGAAAAVETRGWASGLGRGGIDWRGGCRGARKSGAGRTHTDTATRGSADAA